MCGIQPENSTDYGPYYRRMKKGRKGEEVMSRIFCFS